ncbi:hypothetical protein TWF694_004667 [Orbilia ellipsospora]|uniref:Uncharacterized protein n=1 Tax=Orbilia ellipsospora TaxID=2528407 RepID=A0AAV9WVU1_9PEZI
MVSLSTRAREDRPASSSPRNQDLESASESFKENENRHNSDGRAQEQSPPQPNPNTTQPRLEGPQNLRPEYPYVDGFKASDSPANRFALITEWYNSRPNDVLDVIKYELTASGEQPAVLCNRDHFLDFQSCREFLDGLKHSPPKEDKTILLLFEDLPVPAVDILGSLGIPGSFLVQHTVGIHGPPLRTQHDSNSNVGDLALGVQPLPQQSIGRMGTRTLFRNKNRVPCTDSLHLDWSRVASITQEIRGIEAKVLRNLARAEVRDAIKTAPMPVEDVYALNEFQDPPNASIYVEKHSSNQARSQIDSRIYRPHQAISLLDDTFAWTVAAEERISRFRVSYEGWDIIIFLFDKARRTKQDLGWCYSHTNTFDFVVNRWELLMSNREIAPTIRLASTRELFIQLLGTVKQHSIIDTFTNCEILLIEGLCLEYWDVLSAIEITIDEIDREMSNQAKLQDSVIIWQKLLSDWRPVFSHMRSNIRALGLTLQHLGRQYETTIGDTIVSQDLDEASTVQQEVLRTLAHVVERSDRAFQAIMSSMSIIESQHAIAEASSVGKLTELAFLFIPITFAATFYSMDIDNLNPTLSKFFILAVILSFSAYASRLIIHSRARRKFMSKIRESIHTSRGIPRGRSIPTSYYITHFLSKLLTPSTNNFDFLFSVGALIFTLPPLLFYAHSTPFKVTGGMICVGIAVLAGYHDHLIKSHRLLYFRTLLIATAALSILAITLEGKFGTGLKVSISFAVTSVIATLLLSLEFFESKINSDYTLHDAPLYLKLPTKLTAFCGLVLIPSAMILVNWSGRPNIKEWAQSLLVIGFIDIFLLFSRILLGRERHGVVIDNVCLVLSILAGIPLTFVWLYAQPPTIARSTQIIATTAIVWFAVMVILPFRTFGRSLLSLLWIPFYLSILAGLCTFTLLLWLGKLSELEDLSTNFKAGLIMLCVWIMVIIVGLFKRTFRLFDGLFAGLNLDGQ